MSPVITVESTGLGGGWPPGGHAVGVQHAASVPSNWQTRWHRRVKTIEACSGRNALAKDRMSISMSSVGSKATEVEVGMAPVRIWWRDLYVVPPILRCILNRSQALLLWRLIQAITLEYHGDSDGTINPTRIQTQSEKTVCLVMQMELIHVVV